MRTVLVTGSGGAGRTTVSAATALAAARSGLRVLLLTDGWPLLSGEPGLTVSRIDSGAHFRSELMALQERSAAALELLGADRLDADELTELPGAEQFALLSALLEASGGDSDLVVVDMPPTPQALAVLALPEQLRRYLRRLVPPERQAARALRPMLAQLAGVPMPAQWLYATAARWQLQLAAVQAVTDAPDTVVRLVAEPGPAAGEALRTARLGLALHGHTLDMVTANRLLPTGSPDAWLAALAAQQQEHLKEMYADFGDVQELAHLGRDPRSSDDLNLLSRPEAPLAAGPGWSVEDRRAEDDGVLVWRLPLPGAAKDDVGLVRRGDELLLTVGPFRRIVSLPSALRRCTVSGAGLADGVLSVRFTPDPALWPQTQ
ncbi:ArsA family ATPase [Streptomyces beijiangensis]|uniref:ArsA family ATPase n=1 Tax=Streptomyces beijiangensis TaxID=163361 RepID=A0A939F8F1_9ACTN|nr:ArsA family ATPase [Streptomyces beijiangensis]MBO0513671.1 ArsA family ATPase [Streptomyces beijiangensis]